MEFMRAHPEGFASVEEAADAVSAFLPHRPRPKDVSGLAKNLRLDPDGRHRWHWDPAFMQAGKLGRDTMNPERFEDAARTIRAPALLVRGGKSEIVNAEGVAAFRTVMPHAESTFPGCGRLTGGGGDVVDGGDGDGVGGVVGCATAVAVARPNNTATMLSNKATRQRRGRNVDGVAAAIGQAPTIPLRISTTSGASAARP